ncbi:EAL domain-containing protein [Paenibacillus psychroresistens]|uniref:EAL domain-containing protein n=1 Tax=Paenibacillus psychroresistens TaxID=1778678 RepID=A0A6B8RQQ0_9BACL|nr:EAL domain-containing protein [Paenibacillus psychroresistens]QGQ97813.1 EAL domain-containing protein [Paenibacillus psychroresistens]
MKSFFLPSVSLMNRLSYLQKFSLIGLFFLLPIGLTLYLLISDLNAQINVIKLEKKGVAYNAAIRYFIEDVQQHRGRENILLNGDAEFKDALVQKNIKILADIEVIHSAEATFDSKWQASSTWFQIEKQWDSLQKQQNKLAPVESFSLHTKIIKDSLVLINQISSYSKLKLDSDNHTYIESLLIKLPETLETIGQARGLSAGVVAKRYLSESEAYRLITLSGTINPQFDDIKKGLLNFNNSLKFKSKLPEDIDNFGVKYVTFRFAVDKLVGANPDFTEMKPNQLFDLGTEALDAGFKLYDDGLPLLNQLLNKKSDELQQKKYFVAGFTGAIWLILVYLFVGFYLSVLRAVYKLMRAAARMSNGDLSERIYLDTKDELQSVGNAYNKMAISLDNILKERDSQEEKIKFLAYHDALTRLPNRVLFQDRLGQALALAARSKELVGVMFLDLDRFKSINDTFGHSVGDILLQTVAERLKSCLRASDTVTRMGGDEFLLILTGLSEMDQITILAEKLLLVLAKPLKLESIELTISGSLGISVYPQDGNDQETLIRNADAAMYNAKSQGRNNYQLYDIRMNLLAKEQLQMEEALRKALVRDEFVLHYQPRQHVASGQITAVEALIRWQHPKLGLLYPSEFISMAEETGLIVEIGEWVLRTACLQNKAWQKMGINPKRVSVNISSIQFQRDDFYQTVLKVIEETGLEPFWLELELTESMVMRNATMTIAKLNQLRELGVKISLDDFGTGFSSLSYLKLFPIDIIKIDSSFIQDVSADSKDAAITKTIIALSRRLKLSVVAEGVETYEQLSFLRSRKCNEIQGFIISKPLAEEEITLFLQAR